MPEIERDRLGKEALLCQGRPMLRHHLATTCNPWGRSPPATMQEACLFGSCVHPLLLADCACDESYRSLVILAHCSTVTQSRLADIIVHRCFLQEACSPWEQHKAAGSPQKQQHQP